MLDEPTETGPAEAAAQEGEAALQGQPNATTPRYLLLARALQDAVQSGTFPVGSLLPTEVGLAAQYSVSRQTVRQAIGQLRQQGLLSARKGVGTRVEARDAPKRFSYSATSASDLVEIAEGSELSILTSEVVTARGRLAAALGCRADRRWLNLGCTRSVDADQPPLCWVNVYIDWRIASTLKLPPTLRAAIFQLVERHSGESLTEIHQEIRATTLDANMAARLAASRGSTGLEITRRYFSTGRRLMMMSINTLPSDRFVYSVSLKRD